MGLSVAFQGCLDSCGVEAVVGIISGRMVQPVSNLKVRFPLLRRVGFSPISLEPQDVCLDMGGSDRPRLVAFHPYVSNVSH